MKFVVVRTSRAALIEGYLLTDITIVIPTFHRRGYLKDCLQIIGENLPECEVVVVSDDGVIPQTKNEIYLPYDSGLTAKRNAGVQAVHTKYALIASDDYDFSSPLTRAGIVNMVFTLKYIPSIDVVAGRVNNKPYEGYLEYVPGEYIKEHRLIPIHDSPFQVDIAANYFLARTQALLDVPYVNTFPYDVSKQHPQYREFRRRCWQGHEQMMKKRNIKKYFGFDEEVK